MKICNICKKSKSKYFFYKQNGAKDGLDPRCIVCHKEYKKANYKKNIDAIKIKHSEYYYKNLEKTKSDSKKWRDRNKEKIKKDSAIYYLKNKEKINAYKYVYERNRRIFDCDYRTIKNLRRRVNYAFFVGGLKKEEATIDLLGADFRIVKKYIERQFAKGMSWCKVGKQIHIDHKIPLSSAKNEEELRTLCHYTNLQPLWAKDNLSKSNKIIPTQMILTI